MQQVLKLIKYNIDCELIVLRNALHVHQLHYYTIKLSGVKC